MDQTHKCKTTYKLLEDNIWENLGDLGYGNDFLNITPKKQSMKELMDKLNLIKSNNFCFAKMISNEWEDKPWTGRKCLQKTHVKKDYYPKYTKNLYKTSSNSTIRKQKPN